MRKPSVTLTSPFGVEVVGLAVGGHGGGLRFGGFSFCSVSGFTKETHRRSVGSSPEASPPCAWELTALCFCLQGTSGPDPTTVYVDMRALRHDRYGAPAASPLGAGAACVRCGQSPEEQLPPPPPPLEDQDAPYVGEVDGEGCGVAASRRRQSARLSSSPPHTPSTNTLLP